jgi:hypothetical protein
MSYDLMVFDPAKAPKKRQPFLDWYDQQSEWEEPHNYDDPAVCTPALQAFFAEIAATFPPLSDLTEDGGTDYTIGANVIYMSFAWDQIELAHETVSRLAAKHALGFFDVSSDLAEVWLPNAKGGLSVAHSD